MILESHYYGANVETLIKLCWAQGVVLLAAQQAGAEIHYLSPSEVKLAVTGTGGANKKKVAHYILALWDLNPVVIDFKKWAAKNPKMKTDDITDALAILHTWRLVQRGEYHLNRKKGKKKSDRKRAQQ